MLITNSGRLVLCLSLVFKMAISTQAQVTLGDAPLAPTDLTGLPGGGPRPLVVNGGFTVDTTSREQVREFYNAVYLVTVGVPINSTAVVSSCVPGTNSPLFTSATLRRLNWYRALAGIPAAVTFDAAESAMDQSAALMMAAQGTLQHAGNWTGWNCLSADGTNAAGSSNLVQAENGPDAITAYVWDFGTYNYDVGHRRWILYPQTQIMATGDVPAQGSDYSVNALWVFDANYGATRPATRTAYVAWPPAGYVPYQVVYPQWSFALTNAAFTNATITMTSNGVPVAVTKQTYVAGYGENTLVWYPTRLDPTTTTVFPFSGTDTVYAVTISNVVTAAGAKNYSYNVTVFDPAVPGTDYVPLIISGTNQPIVNAATTYSCTPSANPNSTGYQWLSAQVTNGNLVDKALNGLTNFTIAPVPGYSIITNAQDGSGNCFHLTHASPVPQLLQFNEVLFPTNTGAVSFKSLLGYANTAEVARVQVSTNFGTTWQDLYAQAGSGGAGEAVFTLHTLSLAAYAGRSVRLRFDYDFTTGSYYTNSDPHTGWNLENISVTNVQQLVNIVTNTSASTNLTLTPTQTGNYILQVQRILFGEFPIDPGTNRQLTVIAGPPLITLQTPVITGSQVKINFTLVSGTATNFHLLQANQLSGSWSTNGTAVLTTNVAGSAYQFTTTNGPTTRFYRVQTP